MVTRELVEERLVVLVDLGTAEVAGERGDVVVDQVRDGREFTKEGGGGIGNDGLDELGVEASGPRGVLVVEEVGGVVHAAGEVTKINTLVGVDAVHVTSNAEGIGVGGVVDGDVVEDVRGLVLVQSGALVPG